MKAKNVGIGEKVIEILKNAEHEDGKRSGSMWTYELFEELKKTYPNVTHPQMHGTLQSLVEYGKIYHLARGAYGHPEAYSGVE